MTELELQTLPESHRLEIQKIATALESLAAYSLSFDEDEAPEEICQVVDEGLEVARRVLGIQ